MSYVLISVWHFNFLYQFLFFLLRRIFIKLRIIIWVFTVEVLLKEVTTSELIKKSVKIVTFFKWQGKTKGSWPLRVLSFLRFIWLEYNIFDKLICFECNWFFIDTFILNKKTFKVFIAYAIRQVQFPYISLIVRFIRLIKTPDIVNKFI